MNKASAKVGPLKALDLAGCFFEIKYTAVKGVRKV